MLGEGRSIPRQGNPLTNINCYWYHLKKAPNTLLFNHPGS